VRPTRRDIARCARLLEARSRARRHDILKAADYASRSAEDPSRLAIICFMTDAKSATTCRSSTTSASTAASALLPLWHRYSVNRFLIEGMAREGRGQAEFVTLEEPGNSGPPRSSTVVADPLLLDIPVDWGGLPSRHLTAPPPDVFRPTIIGQGRYTKPGNGTITVRGLLRGKPWSQTLNVTLPENDRDGSAIATLWARERIEDLQNQDWLGAQTGKRNENITQQIVATALDTA
jgi:Ca-activated chloride channel family protein